MMENLDSRCINVSYYFVFRYIFPDAETVKYYAE
jgi:hypothetical protein